MVDSSEAVASNHNFFYRAEGIFVLRAPAREAFISRFGRQAV
jgi:hypothetical protein